MSWRRFGAPARAGRVPGADSPFQLPRRSTDQTLLTARVSQHAGLLERELPRTCLNVPRRFRMAVHRFEQSMHGRDERVGSGGLAHHFCHGAGTDSPPRAARSSSPTCAAPIQWRWVWAREPPWSPGMPMKLAAISASDVAFDAARAGSRCPNAAHNPALRLSK